MAKDWEENFDALLRWLDADRARAGAKHEQIRDSLINIFSWRGFRNADELAEETIARVSRKVEEIAKDYKGDPARYFYAVAKKIFLEAYKREQRIRFVPIEPNDFPTDGPSSNEDRPDLDCLDECLKQLSPADRDLVLLYYQQEQPKISKRKELARSLGLSQNSVRIKVFRIRQTLQSCIEDCLGISGK